MPLLTSLRKLACCAAPDREEAEAPARPARPEPVQAGPEPVEVWPEPVQAGPEPAEVGPEPAEAGPAQGGRPYRDFVEGEAARFRREIENAGSLNEAGQQEGGIVALLSKPGQQEAGAVALLTEPGRQEAGAVALPELPSSRRGSPHPQPGPVLTREQMAVHVVQMYLVKKGFIKPPYSRLESTPDHVEALFQLQADANWQARVFPLPAHPDPQHPAIYYYINDPVSNRPVPTEDSLIRGDYVYDPADGSRIIPDEFIYPWRGPDYQPSFHDICSRGWCAYYTFSFSGTGPEDRPRDISPDEAAITYHWIEPVRNTPVLMRKRDRIMSLTPFGNRVLKGLHFSPGPPSPADIFRLRRTRDQLIFDLLGST